MAPMPQLEPRAFLVFPVCGPVWKSVSQLAMSVLISVSIPVMSILPLASVLLPWPRCPPDLGAD